MLITLYFSASSDGSDAMTVETACEQGGDEYGFHLKNITETTFDLITGASKVMLYFSDTGSYTFATSGYARIVAESID